VGDGYSYIGSGTILGSGVPSAAYIKFHYNTNNLYIVGDVEFSSEAESTTFRGYVKIGNPADTADVSKWVKFSDNNSSAWRSLGWNNNASEFQCEDNSSVMRTIIHSGNISSYAEDSDWLRDVLQRGYSKGNVSATVNLPVGWYTIAVNTGSRASAKFSIWDVQSGMHQTATFYAAHHYGMDHSNTINVLSNSFYANSPLRYIRIKELGTYDGAALQVYIDQGSNTLRLAITGDNVTSAGWSLTNFIPDDTDPGVGASSGVWADYSEKERVDLDRISGGGLLTSGVVAANHGMYVGDSYNGSGDDSAWIYFRDYNGGDFASDWRSFGYKSDKFQLEDNTGTLREIIHTGNISTYAETSASSDTWRGVTVDTTGNGSANATLGSAETLMLKKGSNVTLTESGGVVTISATDTNTDTNTWKLNTATVEGYVSAPGSGNADKVWKTNASGVPGWRADASGSSATGDIEGVNITAGTGLTGTLETLTGTHTQTLNVDFSTTSLTIGQLTGGGADNILTVNGKNVDGQSIVAAGDIVAMNNASDDRLKTNTNKINNALDKVASLEGFSFDWNDAAKEVGITGEEQVGLSAQSLEKVLPQVVKGLPDSDYKMVDYQKIVPLLVEAIKELKSEIEELKGKQDPYKY